MADKLQFVFPGKPEYTTMIRLSIGAIADSAGFNFEETEDIKMALAEACKNICCHGNSGFAEKIEVICNVNEKNIELTVTDISQGNVIERLEKPCMDCPKEGDLGIFVIKSLMDTVEVNTLAQGNKSIRMVKGNGQ